MYADDTAILSTSLNPNDIVNSLEKSLNSLSSYFEKWKIKINTDKTQATFFTNRRAPKYIPDKNVKHSNTEIEWHTETKYLGLVLDKKLKFSKHISHIQQKSQRIIRLLYPLINRKSKMNKANKLILYKSVFRPVISFGCPIWNVCAHTHLNKLQNIQNKILKIMLNRPFFYRTNTLHKETNLLYLKAYFQKLAEKFKQNTLLSENPLLRQIQNAPE